MENLRGLLRIHLKRGINLAIRDITVVKSSDPYVVLKMGDQKVKSRMIKHNLNPEWNEDLTIPVEDTNLPIKLFVYDKDTFTLDDKMGEAEIQIGSFLDAVKMRCENLANETTITKIQPSKLNCLAKESTIVWSNGNIVQNMVLKLQKVESGEIELRLHWIDVPGSKGL